MPKEVITRSAPEIDESGNHFQYGDLSIHWGKDQTGNSGAVQIGMTIDAEYLHSRVAEGVTEYGFFTDGLSEAELTKLIKVLLKAREFRAASAAWKQREVGTVGIVVNPSIP